VSSDVSTHKDPASGHIDAQPDVSAGSGNQTLIAWLFHPDEQMPIGRLENDQRFAIVTDQLGSPVATYDENGRQVWSGQLDSYGRLQTEDGDGSICPFRFQGQYEDTETGLYYNRFRYYDPGTGTYISRDPIGLTGGVNGYAYVHDPLTHVDPLGLADCGDLKVGDVMTYRDYKAARKKGSSLRGHHVPQQQRLKEVGIHPDDGTVVVLEGKKHGKTRTYGGKGSKAAREEAGKPLGDSEALDLKDPPVEELGDDVQQKIKDLNRENHPDQF
jgi:RHS repeat-associated protein